MNESFIAYATDKIVFNAKAANDYAKRGNLYQAGLKFGTVVAILGCLNEFGVSADCETSSLANGTELFNSITVGGEKILDNLPGRIFYG